MSKYVGVILAIGGVAVLIFKKRSEKMKKQKIEVDKKLAESVEKIETVKVVPRDENGLSDADKRELKERFEGMSPAEIDIFMDLVPVELCIKRIEKDLNKAKEFEKTIKSAMSGLI